jgi:phospholipid/cholesterol/gamma-HCH transport system substrate-binding protein
VTRAAIPPARHGRPRRELRRQDYARRGLVALTAGALVLTVVWLRASGAVGGPDHVVAQLADAGGSLGSGADVKIRGVIIGKVDEISRGPAGGVRVGIAVRGNRLDQVPDNVVARILPATVFGTSFVDLVTQGEPSHDALRAGAVIPADTTQGTLELQQALDDIDALVKALGPADLASAIGSVAQALDGRGDQLGTTIDLAADYLARLNPKMPQVREDVRKLAANLELVAEVAPDLLAATDDALVTARTVVSQQAAIATLIRGGTALTTQADEFLRHHRPGLVRFVQNAALLLDVIHANRHAGITGSIQTNRLLSEKVGSVVQHGFINAVTTFLLDVPPYYTSADCPRVGVARGDNCPGPGRAGAGATTDGGAR